MFGKKRKRKIFERAAESGAHKVRKKALFPVVLSLALLFAAGLGGCSEGEQSDKGQPTGTTGQTAYPPRESVYTLMGIAAYKSFDSPVRQTVFQKTPAAEPQAEAKTDNDSGSDADAFNISYPFDYLKILSAVKFSAEFSEPPDFLTTYCGEGELEYVIAEFETYAQGQNGEVLLQIEDTLLAVRGSKGYYCSLSNSYSLGCAETGLEEGARFYAFSSHKKLGENSVDKDFTPPIHMLYTKENAEGFAVAYGREEGMGGVEKDTVFTPMSCEVAERITAEKLYGTEELSRLPQAEVTGTANRIEKAADGVCVYLLGASPSRLFIDAAAVWIDEKGERTAPQEIAEGDVVTASYDDLFEGYAPDRVRANTIRVQKSQKNFDKGIDKASDS